MNTPKTVRAYSGNEVRIPNYGAKSIDQLPEFFKSVLEAHSSSSPLHSLTNVNLNGIKRVVFFLIDGFGYAQWQKYVQRYAALQQFQDNGSVEVIDSVFPASTPVALNTLHTFGKSPAQHGLVDWWLYVEELDDIVATLPFTNMRDRKMDSLRAGGASADILLRGKTTYELLAESGISSHTFIKALYQNSTYTQTAYKGSTVVPHDDAPGLFASLEKHLKQETESLDYCFAYWADIDTAGHMFGLESEEYVGAADTFFGAMAQFFESVRANKLQDTLFVMSADHGQVSVDPEETLYLDDIEGLDSMFSQSRNGKPILPWGGAREVFASIKDEQLEQAIALINDAIGDKVELIKIEDALKAGLFGDTGNSHPHLKSRLGNLLILPKNQNTVWYHHPDGSPFTLKGHHGGHSEIELQVPFAVLRSSDLK